MKVWIKSKGKLLGPIEDNQVAVALARGIIGKDAKVSDNRTEWYSIDDLMGLKQRTGTSNEPTVTPVARTATPPPPPPAYVPQSPKAGMAQQPSPYAPPPQVAIEQQPMANMAYSQPMAPSLGYSATPMQMGSPAAGGFPSGNYCTSCGKPVVAEATICPYCGCSPTRGRNFCQGCGAPLNPGQKICFQCGRTCGKSHEQMARSAFRLSLIPLAFGVFIWGLPGMSDSFERMSEESAVFLGILIICMGIAALVCIIISFVLSIMALVRICKSPNKKGRGFAIAGLAISGVQLTLPIIFWGIIMTALFG